MKKMMKGRLNYEYLRFRKTLVEQESLLEEVAKLDRDVIRLNQEKEELYALITLNY